MIARWPLVLVVVCGLGGPAAADAPLWSSDDYFRHYMQYFHGKVPLPHSRSTEQALLFNHMVDGRNITHVLGSVGSPERKLVELRKILGLIGAYRASYNLAVTYGEPLEQELTRVQAFGLEVAAAVATLSQHTDRVPCTAITSVIAGMIESISEDRRYTADQIAEIAEAIARHYPQISPALAAADREYLFDKAAALDVRVSSTRQRLAVAAMWSAIAAGH
jgi:hypothetical protein